MNKEELYARMMHTPDDPERAALREALREAWKQLLPLHRSLIDAARDEYLARGSTVNGPGHLLGLLQDDPFFAWLKPLTSLIVSIDSMTRTDFTREDVAQLTSRLTALFDPAGEGEFSVHYLPILQRDVDVAIGHAAVRQLVAKLKPGSGSSA